MTESNKELNERVASLEKQISGLQQKVISLEKQLNDDSTTSAHSIVQSKEQPLKKAKHTIKSEKDDKQVDDVEADQVKSSINQQEKNQTPNLQQKAPTNEMYHQEEMTNKVKKPPKEDFQFDQFLGIWLPRIFMGVLILGVLWALKVGLDNGWISYEVRIVLGYAATLIILYFGMKNINKEQRLFGITLISGVIAIGLLVTVAAYYLYGFLNYPLAMFISIFYIVLGLFMSKKTKSEVLTIFSGFAGFLLPFLIAGTTVETWTFCLYILILFISLFYIAIDGKHKLSYYVTFFFSNLPY